MEVDFVSLECGVRKLKIMGNKVWNRKRSGCDSEK